MESARVISRVEDGDAAVIARQCGTPGGINWRGACGGAREWDRGISGGGCGQSRKGDTAQPVTDQSRISGIRDGIDSEIRNMRLNVSTRSIISISEPT